MKRRSARSWVSQSETLSGRERESESVEAERESAQKRRERETEESARSPRAATLRATTSLLEYRRRKRDRGDESAVTQDGESQGNSTAHS